VGRIVDVDHLVPARVIAERLRWKRVQLVHYYWRSDPSFPDPVYSLTESSGGVRLWCWPDVETWATGRGLWPLAEKPVGLSGGERVTADG
jgi:hypothetical protein